MDKRKLSLLLTAALATACARPPALQWERINPLPTDADLRGLTSARGLTVAVGQGGTILTTADGRTWTPRPTSTTADLYGVTAALAGFVAVGDGVILTSPDGKTWTARKGAAGKHLKSAACGERICVTVGEGGAALTGRLTGKWTPVAIGTKANLNSIGYWKGRFVAAGNKGEAYASADGRAWQRLQVPLAEVPPGFYNDLLTVTAAQDQWLIGGAGRGSFVLTSPDAATWTLRAAGEPHARLLAAADGRILRLAFREKAKSQSLISTDQGNTWQVAENNLTVWPFKDALVWDGAQFLLAGRSGTVMASADGIAWEHRLPQGHWQSFTEIAFGAGRFVAVANGDIGHSEDGLKWTIQERPSQLKHMRHIVRGPDRFVATGLGAFTSPDGLSWTPAQAPADWPLGPVVWGSGGYVAVRSNQTLTSADGTTWQTGPPLGPERYFEGLVAGGSGYLAYSQTIGGAHNEIYTSADGLTWTSRGLQPRLISMAHGKGLYVGFTGPGTVITSPDGQQWTEVQTGLREAFRLFFAGGRFVAMGTETVLLSADGRKWSPAGRQPARHGISGLAFGHGRLVGVGDVGSIIVNRPEP